MRMMMADKIECLLCYWIIMTGLFGNLIPQINGLSTYLEACDSEDAASRNGIVYPILFNQSETLPLNTYNTVHQQHEAEVLIGLRYNSRNFILKLRHNSGIMSGKPSKDSGLLLNTQHTTKQESQNCFYQGFVQNSLQVEDFATVSTCNGIRGVVHFNGEAFLIKPLVFLKKTQVCQAHMISKLEPDTAGRCANDVTSQWTSFTKLHSTEYHKQLSSSSSQAKVKRNLESKHLALGLIVDQKMSELFERNEARIREYLLDVTNLIDLYYQRLNVRVSLTYYKVWSSTNEIALTQTVRETLQNFLMFSKSMFTSQGVDSLHLLSGSEFEGSASGLSIPDSICTDRALSVISVKSLLSNPEKVASEISHMIGHNIGLEHDTAGCECAHVSGKCIMNDIIGEGASYQFSSCSMERFELLTRVKLGQCLSSYTDAPHYTQICGNGIIERGEQCDCGPIGACGQIDPCCNATTCLLKSWATCRSGACCERCLPKSTQSLCRPGQNDCDAPEYCDGTSGECPADESIENGQPCDGGAGVCYQGHCPTRTKQCQLVWGEASQSSDDTCYDTNNLLGSVYGHCGKTADGYYQRCTPYNAVCGLLQCTGGDNSPVIPNVKHSMTTTNVDSQDEVICKTINTTPGSHQYNRGLVSDGTSCGDDHLCMGQSCVPISTLYARGCLVSPITNTTCSGHGRCATNMLCSCDVGYGGRLCDTLIRLPLVPTTSLPLPVATTQKWTSTGGISTGVISGILVTTLLLITVIIATIFLYRRRVGCFDKMKKHKMQNGTNGHSANNGSIVSYDIAYPTGCASVEIGNSKSASSGRRRRRRRRRHHSSSSDDSSDSTHAELPCVIYDVPVQDNLPKGILKKPVLPGGENPECSDSQCSCGDYSHTCSENEDEPNFITTIPKPDTELDCDVSPSHSPDAKFSCSAEADQEYQVLPYQHLVKRDNHDSASDSAIELLPHCDSSMSTLNESSAFTKISPPHMNRPPPRIHYVTALQPVPASNSSSANSLMKHSTDNQSDRPPHHNVSNSSPHTIQYDQKILQPEARYECDASQSLLQPKEDDITPIECPTAFTFRPHDGPMRTFQPIGRQHKPSKIYDQGVSDLRSPFLT